METEQGLLAVVENLHIKHLNLDQGEIIIDGYVRNWLTRKRSGRTIAAKTSWKDYLDSGTLIARSVAVFFILKAAGLGALLAFYFDLYGLSSQIQRHLPGSSSLLLIVFLVLPL